MEPKIERNITPVQFKKLKELLAFVWKSRRSSFYRDIFKKSGIDPVRDIKKPEDYLKLPFLTRSILLEIKPDDRLYLPLSEVDYVRATSGTTGDYVAIYHKHKYKSSKSVRSTFLVFPKSVKKVFYLKRAESIPPMYEGMRRLGKLGIFGNRSDLESSASFAAQVGVDALVVIPPEAVLFGRVLAKYYDLEKIKFVQIHGRMTTNLQRAEILKLYPKALVLSTYSMNEIGPIGIQCAVLAKKDFNTYHTFSPLIYEGYPLGRGLGQELTLTTLEFLPTPIIRYRTGDRVEFIQKTSCVCGRGGFLIRVLGRAKLDTAQIGTEAMVRIQELEEAISWAGYKDCGFELNISEVIKKGGSPVPVLELVVFIGSDKQAGENDLLKAKILGKLHFVPRYRLTDDSLSLAQFLKDGKVASFSVSLKPMQKGQEKIRRIIDHRSE